MSAAGRRFPEIIGLLRPLINEMDGEKVGLKFGSEGV